MQEANLSRPGDDAARSDEDDVASTFAPYAQLIKMLLPRSAGVAIYGPDRESVWCSGGFEKPDYRDLLAENAPADLLAPSEGVIVDLAGGQSAFVEFIAANQRPLGSVLIELNAGIDAWNETVVRGLVRPVIRCLQSALAFAPVTPHTEPAREDQVALNLLLGADEADPRGPSPLHQLVQHSVEQLECEIGALVITAKGIVVTYNMQGNNAQVSSDLLDRTQKNLLAWAQLNRRTMLVNRVGAPQKTSQSYKILSCPVYNPTGEVEGILALFRTKEQEDFDVKDVRILEYIARRATGIVASSHDPLTGLPNRPAFEKRAQACLMDTSQDPQSLLYIDIDHLQAINEAFGYAVGDEVITSLAQVVQRKLTPDDTACRLGGDRIAIYLGSADHESATRFANDVVAQMAAVDYASDESKIEATVSVGVLQAPAGTRNLSHLLAVTQLGCKQAKENGGNQAVVVGHDQVERRRRPRPFQDSVMLEKALKQNEFRLQAQPIVGLSLNAGHVVGHELLLRMVGADGGLVSPDKFIDLAAKYGLMSAIDRWVVATAAGVIRESGKDFSDPSSHFTINVSAQSLAAGDFVQFAANELIIASQLPAQAVRFELKESAAIRHVKLAARFTREMTEAGFQVGLDDFGIRLSSFADLKDLPVHYLRIHGGLVRRVESDRYARSLIHGITKAADVLGIFTIAEHVESQAAHDELCELSIAYGQGYYFGRPEPIERVYRPALAAES